MWDVAGLLGLSLYGTATSSCGLAMISRTCFGLLRGAALLIFFNCAAALLRCYIQWFSNISIHIEEWRQDMEPLEVLECASPPVDYALT